MLGQTADQLLGEAGRTYRKYGTAFIPVTQQPRDLLATPGGQAARDNTWMRLLFPQPPDVAAVVGEELLSLHRGTGAAALAGDRPGEVCRSAAAHPARKRCDSYRRAPSVYWIATTQEKERIYIDEFAQRLGSLEQAIAQAAQDYPHGLPRSEEIYG